MATNVQLQGEIVKASRQAFADGTSKNVQLNHQGAQLAALSLPMNGEVARLGNTFVAGTATPITPVVAIPTTASHLSLYNPSTSGKNFYVHRIAYTTIVTSGAALILQLLAHMTTVAVSTFTGTAASGPKSISGSNTAVGQIYSAATTVVNGVWHPVGPSVNAGAATATVALGGDTGDLGGLYVITPGMHLDMAVLCSAAGGSVTNDIFVTWSEIAA